MIDYNYVMYQMVFHAMQITHLLENTLIDVQARTTAYLDGILVAVFRHILGIWHLIDGPWNSNITYV